jgi:uncharacterized OsmC-like protein
VSTTTQQLNGINAEAVEKLLGSVQANPEKASKMSFSAKTRWSGGVSSETEIRPAKLGGQEIARGYRLKVDEPHRLGGTDTAINPQEVLLTAFNSCVLATYVALCTFKGIEVEDITVESEGELDLRGFLALDPAVKSGYPELEYRVHCKADASEETLREIHEQVKKQSPNFFNMAEKIRLKDSLTLG